MIKTAFKKQLIETESEEIIITRFGKAIFNVEKAIYFPHGLLGIKHVKSFIIVAYPDVNVKSYSLLQSIEDKNLCFLTIPLTPDFFATKDSLLAHDDISNALTQYDIDEANLAIILVATIHNNKNNKIHKVSVNLKAPLLIDTLKLIGYQHVFIKQDYPIKYFIS